MTRGRPMPLACRPAVGMLALLASSCCAPRQLLAVPLPAGGAPLAVERGPMASWLRAGPRRHVAFDGIALRTLTLRFVGDGARVAYAARRGRRISVVVDGQPRVALDAVDDGGISLAPRGGRWASVGRVHGRTVVFDSGRRGPPVDAVGRLRWSGDGSRLVYAARRGGMVHLVSNGRLGAAYGAIDRVVAAARAPTVAMIARSRDAARQLVVVDGRLRGSAAGVSALALSPDGQHVAWVAARPDGKRGGRPRWQLVLDGKAIGAPFDDVRASTLTVGDGGRVLLVARRGRRWHIVFAASRGVSTAVPRAAGFEAVYRVTRDGARWAALVRAGGERRLLVDGRVTARGRGLGEVALGAGARAVYARRRGGSSWLLERGEIVRGRADALVDGTLTFDRSGRRWGCLAGYRATRAYYLLVDGVPRRRLRRAEVAGLLVLGAARRWVRAALARVR